MEKHKLVDRGALDTAKLLIQEHGFDAIFFAPEAAVIRNELGDTSGLASWLRVIEAIQLLATSELPVGVRLH